MSIPMISDQVTNLFETLMATSSDAILCKTVDGMITAWNPAAEQLYGYSAPEMIGQSVTLLIPDDQQDEFPAIMQQLSHGKMIQRYEIRRRHKDGRLLEVSLTISPLKDRRGQVVGALSFTHDISLRKEHERLEMERRSSERFKRFVDANIIGVAVANEETLLEMNEILLNMLGYSREEFTQGALNWAILTPASTTILDQPVLEELRTRGICTPVEKEFVRRDGTHVPVLFGAALLQEEPPQWLCLIQDQTVQKELEHRKDELLTLASHELRTPLTSIRGYLEVIVEGMEEEISPTVRGYLQIVLRNTQRLIALINELLDLARLEAGNMQIERRVLDLNALAYQVAQDLQPLLEAKHQHLSVSPLPFHPVVLGDPNRIIQVLTNLLSNAHKFTPPEGMIALTLSQVQEGVCLRVQDSGIGMTPEELSQLFTKFYRAKPFLQEGTGMGLAMSRAMIEMQGGTITVTSRPGEGSTFCVTLPIVEEATVSMRDTPSLEKRRPRILIVEDEPDHITLLRYILEQDGYEVLSTYRADMAHALATTTHPDLIILDVLLPEGSGFHVLEDMKQQGATTTIPVLLLTIMEHKEQAVLLGALDVLEKPFSPAHLLRQIHVLLREEQHPLVLVAMMDPVLRSHLCEAFQQAGCRVAEASTTEALLQLVASQHPPFVLLEVDMLLGQKLDIPCSLLSHLATLRSSLVVLGPVPEFLQNHWENLLGKGHLQTISSSLRVGDLVAIVTHLLEKEEGE